MKASDLTEEQRDRLRTARLHVHRTTCPPPRNRLDPSCAACPTWLGLHNALAVLDERPRDARAARQALHDVVCQSGCGPESDHADRTQARTVAALRKFRAEEER